MFQLRDTGTWHHHKEHLHIQSICVGSEHYELSTTTSGTLLNTVINPKLAPQQKKEKMVAIDSTVPPRYVSDITDASALAEPLRFHFSGRTAPNRFMKAAMTEQLASWNKEEPQKRGIPTPNLIRVYEKWGAGGIGLILTGNFSMVIS